MSPRMSKLFAAAVLAASGLCATQAQAVTPEAMAARMGSAVPLDHAAYTALPKVRRHRAWLPVSVDLTARFPLPGDQLYQGACTAWATGYAARSFLSSAELGRAPQSPAEIVSPEYIYNRIRPGGLQTCLTPGKITDALDLLSTEGAVTLSEFPYSMTACHQAPPEALKSNAARWRIRAWRAIDHETPDDWRTPINLDDVKGQLAQGLPVIFTMPAPQDFFAKADASIYSHQPSAADPASFHAMALIGYDDDRQAVRLINSWGAGWGDHGYAWLDYATFKRMAMEAYVIEPLGDVGHTPVSPLAQAVADKAAAAGDADAALAALLSSPGCGRIAVTTEGGHRVATGFLGSETDAAFLKARAAAIDPALDWRVELRRWPQCEADLTLQKTLDDSPLHLSVVGGEAAAPGGPVALRQGQLFSIDVETTADHPFVHVIYLQADGSAVELYRNAPPVGPDGRRRAVIGADGAAGVRFQVGAPYGDEMLIALAGTGPLFDDRLGLQVTERQFLTLLRTRLVQASKDGTPIDAAITRIHTLGN